VTAGRTPWLGGLSCRAPWNVPSRFALSERQGAVGQRPADSPGGDRRGAAGRGMSGRLVAGRYRGWGSAEAPMTVGSRRTTVVVGDAAPAGLHWRRRGKAPRTGRSRSVRRRLDHAPLLLSSCCAPRSSWSRAELLQPARRFAHPPGRRGPWRGALAADPVVVTDRITLTRFNDAQVVRSFSFAAGVVATPTAVAVSRCLR